LDAGAGGSIIVGSGGSVGGSDASRDVSSDLAADVVRLEVGTVSLDVGPEAGPEAGREVGGEVAILDTGTQPDAPLPPGDGPNLDTRDSADLLILVDTRDAATDRDVNADNIVFADVPDVGPDQPNINEDVSPDVPDVPPVAHVGTCTNPAWAKAYPGLKLGGGIGLDKDGNLFNANATTSSVDFGGSVGTVTSVGDSDAVISKLDAVTGNRWAKVFGDTSAQTATALAVDKSGHLAFVGDFQGVVKLKDGLEISNPGLFPLAWVGGLQASDGSAAWALSARLSLDETSSGGLFAIAANPKQDDFVACGKANVAATDLNVTGKPALAATGDGKYDIIVAKIKGSDGKLVWSRQIVGAGDQACTAAAIDDDGNVFVAGNYTGQLDLGNGALPTLAVSSWVPWIARLNKDTGETVASMSPTAGATGRTTGYVYGIDTDSAGNVAIVGKFTNAVTFGATTLTSAGNADAYVAKLSVSGSTFTPAWAKRYGDTANQQANSVAFDSGGNMTVVGAFLGNINIGPSGAVLTAASDSTGSNEDVFVARLSGAGDSLCAAGYGDPASQVASSVAISRTTTGAAKDVAFISGAFKQGSVLDFKTTSGSLTSPAGSGSDFWVAKF
jgi:hypothetical protein